jgi:hypothetical protein
MNDDVITGVGALIVIGSALCPFFPQACPAVAGLRAIKTYLEKKKVEQDGEPKPNAPQDVTVKAEEDENQESYRVRV